MYTEQTKKVEVTWNGFDEADFTSMPSKLTHNTIFTIRYVGNLFASQQAPAFWSAIKKLINEENAVLKIEFIGRVDESLKNYVVQNKLDTLVKFNDFVNHTQAIRLICEANALLLIVPNVPFNKLIVTGKIFEYLASENPILAFGNTSGDAAQLLQLCEREPMCDYNDSETAFSQLKKHYYNFLHNRQTCYSDAYKQFSRKEQAKKMATLLENL